MKNHAAVAAYNSVISCHIFGNDPHRPTDALSHHGSQSENFTKKLSMTPSPSRDKCPDFVKKIRELNADDIAAAGRAYPGEGFYPTGTAPYITGAIKGRVIKSNGKALEGVRLWLFDVNPPSIPTYETFTAAADDFELDAGTYVFKGINPGRYYVCILPWSNDVPDDKAAEPTEDLYNYTVEAYEVSHKFSTQCFDNVQITEKGAPSLKKYEKLLGKVTVISGELSQGVNFVTNAQ
jgi:hypothetical protein